MNSYLPDATSSVAATNAASEMPSTVFNTNYATLVSRAHDERKRLVFFTLRRNFYNAVDSH